MAAGDRPAAPPRLWWCNAGFDLTLAHGGGKVPAPVLAAARRLEWDLWPALAPRDALLVSEPPPPGFREGLEAVGLELPRFVTAEEAAASCAGHLFTPFGWNAAAEARARETGARMDAPGLEVVRRVNAREFGASLDPDTPVAVLRTVRELDAWLAAAPPGRYVAKGRHGFAGIAQQRFALPADAGEAHRLRERLRRLHARHDGLCMEPWHDIVDEWGTVARVSRDARVSPPRMHRLFAAPGGGFAGACAGPGAVPEPVARELRRAVERVGAALHAAGYHGPFAFDAYTHRVGGGTRLRAPSDLNVRISMASSLHGMLARFPGRAIFFAQFSATAFGFPDQFHEISRASEILSFNSASRRGFLLITPQLALPRFSAAFIGEDVTDVTTQRDVFMRVLARQGGLSS